MKHVDLLILSEEIVNIKENLEKYKIIIRHEGHANKKCKILISNI